MSGEIQGPLHIQTVDEEEIAAIVEAAGDEEVTFHTMECELVPGLEAESCNCAAIRFRNGRLVGASA